MKFIKAFLWLVCIIAIIAVLLFSGYAYLKEGVAFIKEKDAFSGEVNAFIKKSADVADLTIECADPYLTAVEYSVFLGRIEELKRYHCNHGMFDPMGDSYTNIIGEIASEQFDEWACDEISRVHGRKYVNNKKVVQMFLKKTPKDIILDMHRALQVASNIETCLLFESFDRIKLNKMRENFIREKIAFVKAFRKAIRYKEKIKA